MLTVRDERHAHNLMRSVRQRQQTLGDTHRVAYRRVLSSAGHAVGATLTDAVCVGRGKSQKVDAMPRHVAPSRRTRRTSPLNPVVNTTSTLSARTTAHRPRE
jgi:hypothetical protein